MLSPNNKNIYKQDLLLSYFDETSVGKGLYIAVVRSYGSYSSNIIKKYIRFNESIGHREKDIDYKDNNYKLPRARE